MGNDQIASPSLDIRKTKFTMLKDMQTQADLEKRLREVLQQLNHIGL